MKTVHKKWTHTLGPLDQVKLLWYRTSKPLIHLLLSVSLCGLAAFNSELQAEEFIAEARVIKVEPLTEIVNRRTITAECTTVRPAGSSFSELLHWDLGTGPCADYAQEVAIVGYKVSYEWNKQVHTQIMKEPPGSFVPVHIQLEPRQMLSRRNH
jgi:hypothetical protein